MQLSNLNLYLQLTVLDFENLQHSFTSNYQLFITKQAHFILRTNILLDFVHRLAKILKYNIKNHDVSEDDSSSVFR